MRCAISLLATSRARRASKRKAWSRVSTRPKRRPTVSAGGPQWLLEILVAFVVRWPPGHAAIWIHAPRAVSRIGKR